MSRDEKQLRKMVREMCKKYPDLVAEHLLETMFWPAGLATGTLYQRFSDDTNGNLQVFFLQDGDAGVELISNLDPEEVTLAHRFRTAGPFAGGGESPRTRNALLLLALAIQRDNKEHPQRRGS